MPAMPSGMNSSSSGGGPASQIVGPRPLERVFTTDPSSTIVSSSWVVSCVSRNSIAELQANGLIFRIHCT